MKKLMIWMAVAAMAAGCGGGPAEKGTPANDSTQTVVADSAATVASNPTQQAIPLPESVSTCTMGKVVAEHFADLSFETALPIERVLVRNGQQVRRGQVLAQLDQFKLRNAVAKQERAIEQAQLQMEQAHLQMQDVIISQGYDPDKTSQVPASVVHNADVKSGYALSKSQLASARIQLAAAQHELRSGVLTAPFDGVVANVTIQAHQLAQAGQPVCRVIASGDMAVEFRVMEADLGRYQQGTALSIIPIADKSQHYDATVCEINPVVDKQGAVTIRAHVSHAADLFDGMNVEVILK
jgi:RND family efflux transporter MFP subunit